jgi:hypothetical protein
MLTSRLRPASLICSPNSGSRARIRANGGDDLAVASQECFAEFEDQ